MISEIYALEQTRNLFKGVIEELKSDFRDLLKSKSHDDFINNFKDFVTIEELKKLPDVLRGILHMEVGLALSFLSLLEI